jgi:hypothetical protein
MASKSLRDQNFLKQKLFSKKSKNMKEATRIYKPVQNEAHSNSLEFHIGASSISAWKRIYDLNISKFSAM